MFTPRELRVIELAFDKMPPEVLATLESEGLLDLIAKRDRRERLRQICAKILTKCRRDVSVRCRMVQRLTSIRCDLKEGHTGACQARFAGGWNKLAPPLAAED